MSCVYIINREGHLVRCGGDTEAGYWLRLGRKSVWTEEERKKKSGKANGTTCKIPLESETLRN